MEQRLRAGVVLLMLLPLVAAKSGFLLTCSRAFFSDNNESVYVTLFDIPDPGSFQVIATQQNGNESKTIAQVTQVVNKPIPPSGKVFKVALAMPKLLLYGQLTIKVNGDFGTYSFKNQTDVSTYTRNDATFVQTDKPIYKPAQLLRFRVLPVDAQLRPIGDKATADIWIENPSGIRLAQWLGETFNTGMSQYEMQLSEKPDLGQWTIYVNITANPATKGYTLVTQNFAVEEYVLPKFETVVTPPPFALTSYDNITWKICGRYTYGKLVKGNLSIESSFEGYGSWDRNVYPIIRHEQRIDGCTNYTVYQKDIGWSNYTYRYRPVKVSAKIVEDGTEVEQSGSATISLTNNPLQLTFTFPEYNKRFFKSGMPFVGELTVANPDNTPKSDELIQICAMATDEELRPLNYKTETTLFCKNMTSNEKGIIRFTVPPRPGNVVSLNIQADSVNYPNVYYDDNVLKIYQPTNSIQLRPWHSNIKRYIQILPLTKTIECGATETFTVYLTGKDGDKINMHYQVLSRDGIVLEDSVEYEYSNIKGSVKTDESFIGQPEPDAELGLVSIQVNATYDMAPKGFLLVYYTTDDGEIIADSAEFSIAKCLKNKVGMEFLSTKALPGTNVGIKVTASPKSLCGIGAVDKSVYLLRSSEALTADKVFDALSNYGSNRFGYSYYPTSCVPQKTPGPSTFVRRRRGIISPPFRVSSNFADSLTAFQNGNFLVLTDLTLVTKPCQVRSNPGPIRPYYSAASGYGGAVNKIGQAGAPAVAEMAFDAAPAPAGGFGGSKPVVEVRDYFPETWLWEMDSTDETGEYVTKREIPHTITEWVGNAVCLHPENGIGVSPSASVVAFQAFFVSATLPYSVIRGEIFPVTITVFNYLKECLPITLRLDESKNFTLEGGSLEQTLCVCGGESVSHKYLVKPRVLGQLNFTSSAFTNPSSDVCGNNIVGNVTQKDSAINSLLVEAEGFKRQAAFSNFFCPSNTNGQFSITYMLEKPDNYVEDSGRAEFLVTGDLMGPALRNIENLVQMPTGCGEQNMLNFVPDIFILDYLTNTGKLGEDTKKKLLEYLKTGYQRELTYRHVDGSYSAFGERDPVGSIWLSAFVVKAYQGASKYIFVDKSDISRTVEWIMANQDSQGCFPEVGEVHHSAMKGGSGSNLGSKATLTSYILISLLEAKLAKNQTSVQNALSCLAQETNPTTYTLALMTYAGCLAKAPGAKDKLETLMELRKTKGATEYWEDDSTNSEAIKIETASYAILSLLTCGDEEGPARALPIVRWISQKRNANGGFISTQDTVMALQALASYATNIDKNPINIDIKMNAEGVENQAYHVDETNKLLVQVTKLPVLQTPVVVEATGTGCALVQANLFYNILTPPGFQAFEYNLTAIRGVSASCKKAEITSCMSYNYEDRYSNMAVLEIRLPSGYEVDRDTLEPLKRDSQLYYKRGDINGDKLALYFSKVGPTKKCFSFRLNQIHEIGNQQPSTARLFDYYQPEYQIAQPYTIDEQCP